MVEKLLTFGPGALGGLAALVVVYALLTRRLPDGLRLSDDPKAFAATFFSCLLIAALCLSWAWRLHHNGWDSLFPDDLEGYPGRYEWFVGERMGDLFGFVLFVGGSLGVVLLGWSQRRAHNQIYEKAGLETRDD